MYSCFIIYIFKSIHSINLFLNLEQGYECIGFTVTYLASPHISDESPNSKVST